MKPLTIVYMHVLTLKKMIDQKSYGDCINMIIKISDNVENISDKTLKKKIKGYISSMMNKMNEIAPEGTKGDTIKENIVMEALDKEVKPLIVLIKESESIEKSN